MEPVAAINCFCDSLQRSEAFAGKTETSAPVSIRNETPERLSAMDKELMYESLFAGL